MTAWGSPEAALAFAVACGYCGVPAGKRCSGEMGEARRPHAARVRLGRAVAAHSDPALDEFEPAYGPCGICGVPGLTQRHRIVDAIAGRLAAGEDARALARDYVVTPEAVGVVAGWMTRWPGVWR